MSINEEETEDVNLKEESVELASFGQLALREPKGGAYERLLAQHLILAVSSDPIRAIIHICRATLSLDSKVAEQLKIDKEMVKDILTVALNFEQAPNNNGTYSILWSFSKDGKKGFDRYIKPWLTTAIEFSLPHEFLAYPQKYEEFKRTKFYEKFYESCKNLTISGFRALLNAFVAWASPLTEELSRKVATQVNPTTYSEILSMFQKFQGEKR